MHSSRTTAVSGTPASDHIVPVSRRSTSTADGCVDGGGGISPRLDFVNITSPLQSRLADNQKVVRSHAARQSHLRRKPLMQRVMDWGGRPLELRSKPRSHSRHEYRPRLNAQRPVPVPYAEYHVESCAHNLLTTTPFEPLRSSPHGARFGTVPLGPSISTRGSDSDSPAAILNQEMVAMTVMQADRFASCPHNTALSTFDTSSKPRTCPLCGHQLPLFGSGNLPSTQSSTISPISAVGAGRVDPFSSLPIETYPDVHFLVDHCKLKPLARVFPCLWLECLKMRISHYGRQSIPRSTPFYLTYCAHLNFQQTLFLIHLRLVRSSFAGRLLSLFLDVSIVAPTFFPLIGAQSCNPLRTKCFPLAFMSPALFQVLLFMALIHLVQCGSRDLSGVTVHRGETIRLINKELHNRDRPVSDATIAAVAYLAIIEVSIVN